MAVALFWLTVAAVCKINNGAYIPPAMLGWGIWIACITPRLHDHLVPDATGNGLLEQYISMLTQLWSLQAGESDSSAHITYFKKRKTIIVHGTLEKMQNTREEKD
jgi:hypothetical protein